MATHPNVPKVGGAWWAVPPLGLHRVRHDWSDLAAAVNYRGATFALWVPGNPLSILSLGAVILLHFQTLGVISSSFISLGFCLPMPRNLWDLSSTTRVLNPGHWQWKHQVLTAEPSRNSYIFFFLSNIYSFTWLCLVLVPAQGLFSLHCSMWEAGILTVTCSIFSCSMWDLMLRPGNELGPPNWRATESYYWSTGMSFPWSNPGLPHYKWIPYCLSHCSFDYKNFGQQSDAFAFFFFFFFNAVYVCHSFSSKELATLNFVVTFTSHSDFEVHKN